MMEETTLECSVCAFMCVHLGAGEGGEGSIPTSEDCFGFLPISREHRMSNCVWGVEGGGGVGGGGSNEIGRAHV